MKKNYTLTYELLFRVESFSMQLRRMGRTWLCGNWEGGKSMFETMKSQNSAVGACIAFFPSLARRYAERVEFIDHLRDIENIYSLNKYDSASTTAPYRMMLHFFFRVHIWISSLFSSFFISPTTANKGTSSPIFLVGRRSNYHSQVQN